MEDQFDTELLKQAWLRWQRSELHVGDKRHGPPKLLVEILNAQFFAGDKNALHHLLALVGPPYRGFLRVFHVGAYPSRLNHQIKGLVNAFKGYLVFTVRHIIGLGLSVKHTESGKSEGKLNEPPIGPNTGLPSTDLQRPDGSNSGDETLPASTQGHVETQTDSTPRSLEELRVKVAELCPTLFDIHETWRDGKLTRYVSWKDDEEIQEREWLAACAAFENGLTLEQREDYDAELGYICSGNFVRDHNGHWYGPLIPSLRKAISATAEQRCRAFILCHSKNESQ